MKRTMNVKRRSQWARSLMLCLVALPMLSAGLRAEEDGGMETEEGVAYDTVRWSWLVEGDDYGDGYFVSFSFVGTEEQTFCVEWGDGSKDEINKGESSHKYSYPGNYDVLLYALTAEARITKLRVEGNWRSSLTSLDVSQSSKLDSLYCSKNKLTSLDVSQNAGLLYLDCSDNKLTSLDVSQNRRLDRFEAADNKQTE